VAVVIVVVFGGVDLDVVGALEFVFLSAQSDRRNFFDTSEVSDADGDISLVETIGRQRYA